MVKIFLRLFFILTLLSPFTPAYGQQSDSVSVNFFFPGDDFQRQLLQYQNINALSVKLTSATPCTFHLEIVKSDNGTITRKPFEVYPTKLSADTTVITIIAAPYKNDSIRIGTHNTGDIIEAYPAALLIEALPLRTYSTSDTIPLMAYSQGYKRTYNFNGKKVTSYDICGVRFSKKHPAEWGKEFGIDKYLWFELIPGRKEERQ